MNGLKKWWVHCKEEVDVIEWVYAKDEYAAMDVIQDNFGHLRPIYVEEDTSND